MAPPEAAQEGAQGGWRLHCAAQGAGRLPGAQRIGVVDTVAARQRGGHQSHHLVAGVGPPRRAAQIKVMVYEFSQAQVLGEGGRQEQASIGHQAVVVEGDLDAVGVVAWWHLLGAPFLGSGFCCKTIIPEAQEHLLATSVRRDTHLFGGLGLKRPAVAQFSANWGSVRTVSRPPNCSEDHLAMCERDRVTSEVHVIIDAD